MSNILIGNIISFAAAIFLAVSCVVKSRKQIFILQFMNCAVLAVASYFFGSYAAITTLALCCIRNIFIMKDKFSVPIMTVILILVIACGVLTNNRGLIGLLPVIATVEYTICCHYITDVGKTRISILVNEAIWIIYSFLVLDFSTAITDIIVVTVDIVSIAKGAKA
ncbi:MAG: YgjV family protein [Clostridia bacterium]|nr:YgjV family protein [Clostridia bacterium]